MTAPRFPRVCRYTACRKPFTVTVRERRQGVVYCSAECGRYDRGRDACGRIIRWWLPQYRRVA
jgi:hypothetical protein